MHATGARRRHAVTSLPTTQKRDKNSRTSGLHPHLASSQLLPCTAGILTRWLFSGPCGPNRQVHNMSEEQCALLSRHTQSATICHPPLILILWLSIAALLPRSPLAPPPTLFFFLRDWHLILFSFRVCCHSSFVVRNNGHFYILSRVNDKWTPIYLGLWLGSCIGVVRVIGDELRRSTVRRIVFHVLEKQ